jgi:hypothetical protein
MSCAPNHGQAMSTKDVHIVNDTRLATTTLEIFFIFYFINDHWEFSYVDFWTLESLSTNSLSLSLF